MRPIIIQIVLAVALFAAGMMYQGRLGIAVTSACNDKTAVFMFPGPEQPDNGGE